MTVFKRVALLIVGLLLLAAGLVLGWASSTPRLTPFGTYHAGLTIERLAELSELLVVKVEVSDVLVSSIEGRTGGVQVVLMVKGDVSLGVDLSKARFERMDNVNRVAVLVLPPPSPSRPRLDHSRTRTVLIRKEGLWLLSPGTRTYAVVVDRAMAEAEKLIGSAGMTKDADGRARAHAETVLRAFFRSLNWNVEIQWSDRK